MNEKIQRMIYLSNLRKFTEEEFREFDGFMIEINSNWNGCRHCPAQIAFGQKILQNVANQLQTQQTELTSVIEDIEAIDVAMAIEESIVEPLEIPVGEVKVTSNCSRCKKKKEALNKTPRTKK